MRSIKEAQKAAKKKQQQLVTAGLRGDDYLPPEVLSQLPPTQLSAAGASSEQQGAPKRTKAQLKADARRRDAEAHAPVADDGMPRVVRRSSTVEIAILPDGGRQPRLHAPVKSDAKAFLQQQLFGSRHQRVSAATLSSLKPTGGRFGAASNFATVPLDKAAPTIRKGKKGKGRDKAVVGGTSTLEQMAARIMRKKR